MTAVLHAGNTAEESTCVTMRLDPDEHIVSVSGRSGIIINQLTLTTNKNKSVKMGGEGGNEFDLHIPIGYRVSSFKGGFGTHLNAISVNLQELRPVDHFIDNLENSPNNPSSVNSNSNDNRPGLPASCINPPISASPNNDQN